MKFPILVVVFLVVIVVGLLAFGALLPKRHVATVTTLLPRSADAVWSDIVDMGSWPAWNPAVTKAERKHADDVWFITANGDTIPYAIEEQTGPTPEAPGHFVTRIADDALPFGGTWTWTVTPDGDKSRVTVVEDGVVRPALFRALQRLMLGYTGTQRKYLGALAQRAGVAEASFEESVTHGD